MDMSDEEIKRLIDEKEQELAELRKLRGEQTHNDNSSVLAALRKKNEKNFWSFVERRIKPLKSVKGKCYTIEIRNDFSVYSEFLGHHPKGTSGTHTLQVTESIDTDAENIKIRIERAHEIMMNTLYEINEEGMMDIFEGYNGLIEFHVKYVSVFEDAERNDSAEKEIIFGNTNVRSSIGLFLREFHEIPQEDFDKHMKECLDFVTGNIATTK